jgi:hypothetical protein
MPLLSSFEVLAQPLVPPSVAPFPVPFVVQAYFVQISYPKGTGTGFLKFDLTFEETTSFKQGAGQAGLLAQFINENGVVNNYPTFFTPSRPNGFLAQQIGPGQTKIYSVTVLPPKPTTAAALAPVPQSGTGWRGSASLNPSTANALVATPTQRQIYFSADLKTITDAVVYPVPTASGKTLI